MPGLGIGYALNRVYGCCRLCLRLLGPRQRLLASLVVIPHATGGVSPFRLAGSRQFALDIRERTAKDRPSLTTIAQRITTNAAELERLEEASVVSREQRDTRFREESATSESLSTCQVEIATVSEREVHLKRQVNTINAELKELENTLLQSRETEIALELLRQRIQPLPA